MKRFLTLAGVTTLTAGLAGIAGAQWTGICIDPMNTTPYTPDYAINGVVTPLAGFTMGSSGTVGYGGTMGPCYPSLINFDVDGGYGFGIIGAGSQLTNFDDDLTYTFGFPGDPVRAYNFSRVTAVRDEIFTGGNDDNTSALITGSNIFYVGLSKRYLIYGTNLSITVDGTAYPVNVQLQAKALGDAIRMRWRLTNTGTADAAFGLRFGFTPSLLSFQGDQAGNLIANNTAFFPQVSKDIDNYVGYTFVPGRRPIRTEMRRQLLDTDFPAYVDFAFGQTDYYGMRIQNTPTAETPDATQADQITIGNVGVVLNQAGDNNDAATMSDVLFGDPTGGQQKDNDIKLRFVAAHQRFPVQTVKVGEFRDVVHYIRNTHSTADYKDPFTVAIDTTQLINAPAAGGTNNQSPNPFPFTVWIDNQFATIDKEVPLNNVKVTLTLPSGISLAPGFNLVNNVGTVNPNELQSTTWQLQTDGKTFGDLPITVKVESIPGPSKTLTAIVRVAAAPLISLNAGPNMVTLPYSFGDSSLDSILGLTTGVDYVAYQWNAAAKGYAPTTSIQRGLGYWIVPKSAQTDLALQGPSLAADTITGGLLVNLDPGWNMIGNPYNYPVSLYDLIGVAESAPSDSLTWLQLVQNELVSSSLQYFVPDSGAPGGGTYALTQGNVLIEPHKAYWVFNRSAQPVRLVWPPLFQPFLPGSFRSPVTNANQTDRNWRLQLAARSSIGVDTENFVGVTSDRKKASSMSVPKAPQAPGAKLEMAVLDEYSGQTTRMAQAMTEKLGKNSWKVQVKAEEAGEVTVTWPNLGSLPRGLRAKLTDDVTGEKKDLRTTSGYTFKMAAAGTRTFTLTVEPGGSSKPVIGNVLVQPAGRDNNSPVVVNYALSADALVSVRILSSTGKEIYTVTRGRSDSAGENSVTWTLRDNANRAVAPGTYRVEILAETPGGERVRKVVPVNVIR